MVAKGEVFDTSIGLASLVDVEVGHCLQVLEGRKAFEDAGDPGYTIIKHLRLLLPR